MKFPKSEQLKKFMIIYFIIILAVVSRFVPHLSNFAPITALAIFSAANLGWKKSIALTLAVRFISDLFLGLFAWPLMLAVYAGHLVGILFGLWIKNSFRTIPSASEGSLTTSTGTKGFLAQMHSFGMGLGQWTKIIASSLGASLIFFLVTNFAFLYAEYPHTLSGVIAAYANGLPFFRGTLLGDLGYTVGLFGLQRIILWYQQKNSVIYLKKSLV